jgi:hypothetical protein
MADGRESLLESQKEQAQDQSRAAVLRPLSPEEQARQGRSRAVIHRPQEYAHQTSGIALKVQWPRRRILKKPRSQRALSASSSHCTPVRTDGDAPMREKWQAGSRGEVDKRSEVHEHVTFRTGRVGLLDWLRWHSRRMVRRYGYEVKWIQMDGNGDLSVCEWSRREIGGVSW